VGRYSPAGAAERGRAAAVLDPRTKTIDVARPTGDWRALDRGEVARAIFRAFGSAETSRYANVMPDALPASEHRAWFDFHDHAPTRKDDPYEGLGNSLSPFRVRGMLRLAALVRDDTLAKDVRAWLVKASGAFAAAYTHDAPKVESAPPGSSFRAAEAEYMKWLAAELPRMSLDERHEIARVLFVHDFRIPNGERDRYARAAFPGIDRHAFYFAAVDGWIKDGYPPRDPRGSVHPLYGSVVCPIVTEVDHGTPITREAGRCEHTGYYGWAVADPAREAVFAKGVLDRNDPRFTAVVFHATRQPMREIGDRLRFLRRFEGAPAHWKIGADALVHDGVRPGREQLDEARRLWRASPSFRPALLRWFAMHMENAYDDKEWPELLQGTLLDEAGVASYLADGPEAFRLLPAAWPALAKGGRARAIIGRMPAILDAKTRVHPGHKDPAGTLAQIADLLCDERALGELAEIHAFAKSELPKRPGDGLSAVVEESSPATCTKRLGENEKRRRFDAPSKKPPPRRQPPEKDPAF
jgi:hypothetical protein